MKKLEKIDWNASKVRETFRTMNERSDWAAERIWNWNLDNEDKLAAGNKQENALSM